MSEITTTPVTGGFYRAGDDYNATVYRFMGDPANGADRFSAWSKATDWHPAMPPATLVALTDGATLVAAFDEPDGLGAVVVEHDSGRALVRLADGLWHDSGGNALGWADLAYPVVRSTGAQL